MLVITKLSFWHDDWALGYDSLKRRQFPDISEFSKALIRLATREVTMFINNNC